MRSYGYCCPLIVDDDPTFTKLLVQALAKSGVPREQIRALPDSETAISVLKDMKDPWSPSFLLCDIRLPGGAGLGLLEWVRSHPSLKDVPVFMMSTSEDPKHVARAFELKASSFYVKPAGLPELYVVVDGILAFWHRRVMTSRTP